MPCVTDVCAANGLPSPEGSGLKYKVIYLIISKFRSPLTRGEWIEIMIKPKSCAGHLRLPSPEGSGLKFDISGQIVIACRSPLTRGEWIEIRSPARSLSTRRGLPSLEGSGLKFCQCT